MLNVLFDIHQKHNVIEVFFDIHPSMIVLDDFIDLVYKQIMKIY